MVLQIFLPLVLQRASLLRVFQIIMKTLAMKGLFCQALTHLCLVLFHLVFISMNLPQQIFNALVAELVPFAVAFIQLPHLSYQKRRDLGREKGENRKKTESSRDEDTISEPKHHFMTK